MPWSSPAPERKVLSAPSRPLRSGCGVLNQVLSACLRPSRAGRCARRRSMSAVEPGRSSGQMSQSTTVARRRCKSPGCAEGRETSPPQAWAASLALSCLVPDALNASVTAPESTSPPAPRRTPLPRHKARTARIRTAARMIDQTMTSLRGCEAEALSCEFVAPPRFRAPLLVVAVLVSRDGIFRPCPEHGPSRPGCRRARFAPLVAPIVPA